ncbi:hypothetical protein [Streptomyces sp. RerS4]|uniref:hypothetical protein n=1 Tax=Streptomyces sp. RerS4 TaxID=2942449 RepID=UPI00201C8B7F|nr:hypothetical protein [Streptomyces sp. RerS4]UQX03475.1 hypothetical protein M4D82_25530 [Streptomyces sp. RerS4]
MQIMWRTQVKRITVAIIATVAVAGGVQIANEGTTAGASNVTADAGTPQAPAAAPTSTPTASPDHDEWG